MIIYILFFVILFIVELLYFRVADKYNIIDKPNERSSHSKITLRGGGIIFYVGVLIYFIYSHFSYPYFFAGITLISIISFLDDIKPQNSKFRLAMHLISMLLMLYQWQFYTFAWYYWMVVLFFAVGMINIFNFMDGINGITGGYSFIVLLSFLYINTKITHFADSELIIISLLSLIVFNFFNFRKKAKCFAGDIGSVSIAFVITFLLGKLMIVSGDVTYIVLVLATGTDAVLTMAHRVLLKESLTEPHRKHLYQIMANELKVPHLLVSSMYMFLQVVISIGFFLAKSHVIYLIIVTFALAVTYILFMRKYFHLHMSEIKK